MATKAFIISISRSGSPKFKHSSKMGMPALFLIFPISLAANILTFISLLSRSWATLPKKSRSERLSNSPFFTAFLMMDLTFFCTCSTVALLGFLAKRIILPRFFFFSVFFCSLVWLRRFFNSWISFSYFLTPAISFLISSISSVFSSSEHLASSLPISTYNAIILISYSLMIASTSLISLGHIAPKPAQKTPAAFWGKTGAFWTILTTFIKASEVAS